MNNYPHTNPGQILPTNNQPNASEMAMNPQFYPNTTEPNRPIISADELLTQNLQLKFQNDNLQNAINSQSIALTQIANENSCLKDLAQDYDKKLSSAKAKAISLQKTDIQREEAIIPYKSHTVYFCAKSNGTTSTALFSDFVIDSVIYIEFAKEYGLEKEIGIFTKCGKFIHFNADIINSQKLLTLLNKNGFKFMIKMDKNHMVKLLSNYISGFLYNEVSVQYVPYYNGWNSDDKFVFPESNVFNDKLLSPHYCDKFITAETNEPIYSVKMTLSILNRLHDIKHRSVMLCTLLSGLLYTKLCKIGYELNQLMILNCDDKANPFIDIFLKIYNKGSGNISLKVHNNELKKKIAVSKDELLIVDGRLNNTNNKYLVKTNLSFLVDIFANKIQIGDESLKSKSNLILLSKSLEFKVESSKFFYVDLKNNIEDILNACDYYSHIGNMIKYFVKYSENIQLNTHDFIEYYEVKMIPPIYRRTYVIFRKMLDLFNGFLQTIYPDYTNEFFDYNLYKTSLHQFFNERKIFDEEAIEEIICELLKEKIKNNDVPVIYDRHLPVNDTNINNKLFTDNDTVFFTEKFMKNIIMPLMGTNLSLNKILEALLCTDILIKRKDGYRCKRTIFFDNNKIKQLGFIVLRNKDIIPFNCKNDKKNKKERTDNERKKFNAWLKLQ